LDGREMACPWRDGVIEKKPKEEPTMTRSDVFVSFFIHKWRAGFLKKQKNFVDNPGILGDDNCHIKIDEYLIGKRLDRIRGSLKRQLGW